MAAELEAYSYRVYLSDALYYQGQNKYNSRRWCELLEVEYGRMSARSGDEIAAAVIEAAGLRIVERAPEAGPGELLDTTYA